MSSEDILSKPQPPFDQRVAYGADANQFLEVRLPKAKGPHPVLLNIHGGYWRARYGLAHAGHMCEALRGIGVATLNTEYRRVGDAGGGWPGTFADIRSAYGFVREKAATFRLDTRRLVVMGHSAGGQLALCLAAHERTLKSVISLAGVVDLRKAFAQHLSHDAVAEFLGGKPEDMADHYREADPMELPITHAHQWLLQGSDDDTVPPEFSREYAAHKKKRGEQVELVEIARTGHFELIDPSAEAFQNVVAAVRSALR